MIDLHTHTTVSDGYLSPADLVREAWMAGIRVLAVTDHDTVAGLADVASAAEQFGLTHVPGIEVTAIDDGRDVHVLGYFFDTASAPLLQCLARQREARRDRVRAVAARLAQAGLPVDVDRLLAGSPASRSLGRPAIAAALVAAGYARTQHEAFERWLVEGRPAWVPREGPAVREVVNLLHGAGGIASLAHPVLYDRDADIPRWREAGLDAIEIWHSEHDTRTSEHYLRMARDLDLLTTGGSDFHGDAATAAGRRCPRVLGRVTMPEAEFARLRVATRSRQSA